MGGTGYDIISYFDIFGIFGANGLIFPDGGSIIFCWGNDAKSDYPAWIPIERKFTKLFLSTTSTSRMSVGKPTEGNLGLVRQKRGG